MENKAEEDSRGVMPRQKLEREIHRTTTRKMLNDVDCNIFLRLLNRTASHPGDTGSDTGRPRRTSPREVIPWRGSRLFEVRPPSRILNLF